MGADLDERAGEREHVGMQESLEVHVGARAGREEREHSLRQPGDVILQGNPCLFFLLLLPHLTTNASGQQDVIDARAHRSSAVLKACLLLRVPQAGRARTLDRDMARRIDSAASGCS